MSRFLSKLRNFQWNSVIIRKCLSAYYKDGEVYRIPFGPLRGQRFHYRSDINFHMMLGLWELETISLMRRILPVVIEERELEEGIFCDVGANVGFYSLFFALQQKSGHVFAFEPLPRTMQELRTNISINGIRNITLVQQACAHQTGTMSFFLASHHHASSLIRDWAKRDQEATKEITVKTTTLDDYFLGLSPKPLPHFIKMDIEGGAGLALKGCHRIIEKRQPILFIESHTPDEDQAIGAFMIEHEYDGFRFDDHKWIKDRSQIHPERDGVWGNMLICPRQMRSKLIKILHE